MFIPDPDFYPSRISDPGFRIQKQPQKREVTSILKWWKNLNRKRMIKNSFIARVPVNPPHPPALPKDASTLSAEANGECHDTNKDLSEKYLVFRKFNCSLQSRLY
jgi:hypothetical protein